jgi:hypothetical protein
MMHRIFIVLLFSVLLCSCTMLYSREYATIADHALSASENEAVFQAFRDYLVSKGLKPRVYGNKVDPNRVAFIIGGSSSGFVLRRDWNDILELTYSTDKSFRLRLMRIVHHPADFSDDYLSDFVRQTELFLREATKQPIQLKPISNKR